MHKIFVYGTFLKDECHHNYLKNAKFLKKAKLKGYEIYVINDIPFAIPSKNNKKSIDGEIYSINKKTLNKLDELENQPGLYERNWIDDQYGGIWIYIDSDPLKLRELAKEGKLKSISNYKEYIKKQNKKIKNFKEYYLN